MDADGNLKPSVIDKVKELCCLCCAPCWTLLQERESMEKVVSIENMVG